MLQALSPLDGRYSQKVNSLREIFSESGLIRARIQVETSWFLHLSKYFFSLDKETEEDIRKFHQLHEAPEKVKNHEKITNHDVKAVEYYLKEKMEKLGKIREFIHFGCTSEDINNLSYALMLSRARDEILLPKMTKISQVLRKIAQRNSKTPLLSLTHGQEASPTTFGKEMAVFCRRLERQRDHLNSVKIMGKLNGAVGNYNALIACYPETDWVDVVSNFINSLNLEFQAYSTQIESHDFIAEYCDSVARFNRILLDLTRDLWLYVSRHLLVLKRVENEVGSSTMPHKINPIDFENSEGLFFF